MWPNVLTKLPRRKQIRSHEGKIFASQFTMRTTLRDGYSSIFDGPAERQPVCNPICNPTLNNRMTPEVIKA
jgi:hypothetical protein